MVSLLSLLLLFPMTVEFNTSIFYPTKSKQMSDANTMGAMGTTQMKEPNNDVKVKVIGISHKYG
jgi:hypothetical protein